MSSQWNWNPAKATQGPRYEVLLADYCSLYKSVLVHRDFGRVDASHIWRYADSSAQMMQQGTQRVLAFRDGSASADDTALAVAAYSA